MATPTENKVEAAKVASGPLMVGAGAALAGIAAWWIGGQLIPYRYRKQSGVNATAALAGAAGGLAAWYWLSGRWTA